MKGTRWLLMTALVGAPVFAQTNTGTDMQDQNRGTQMQGQTGQTMDQSQTGKMGQVGPLSAKDRELLAKLHADNQAEQKLGQLALDQGQNQQVKDFGRMLIDDHKAADQQLTDLLQPSGVQISAIEGEKAFTDETKTCQKDLTKLREAKAMNFDRDFLDRQVKDHRRSIDLVQSGLKKVKDPAIKQYLSTVLPKLQQHRDEAQRLLDQAKGHAPRAARRGTVR